MNRKIPIKKIAKSAQGGVVLIEALVAILLFSIGVLALAGLQASLGRHSTESRSRAEASYFAQKRLGEMRADPVGVAAGNYLVTNEVVPGLPDGRITVESPKKVGEYEVTVHWTPPGETVPHEVVVVGNIVENKL